MSSRKLTLNNSWNVLLLIHPLIAPHLINPKLNFLPNLFFLLHSLLPSAVSSSLISHFPAFSPSLKFSHLLSLEFLAHPKSCLLSPIQFLILASSSKPQAMHFSIAKGFAADFNKKLVGLLGFWSCTEHVWWNSPENLKFCVLDPQSFLMSELLYSLVFPLFFFCFSK